MRRIICGALLGALLVGHGAPLSAAAAMENFTVQRLYAGRFTDVPASAWYQSSVARVYELGLMNGKSTYQFQPQGNMTAAEIVALAAKVHAAYNGSKIYLTEGAWYAPYVQYAMQNGIVAADAAPTDWNTAVDRARFVQYLYAALPQTEYATVRKMADGAIPDVAKADAYGAAVYTLYEAGILTGSNAQGSFLPAERITRAQGAVILARMVDIGLRQKPVPASATDTTE